MTPLNTAPLPILKTTIESPQASKQDADLREAAKALEASFLAEMLKSAGYGKPREAFGGGTGEDQFSSFMVQVQAEKIVQAGGIGLAEHLFEALKERQNGSV